MSMTYCGLLANGENQGFSSHDSSTEKTLQKFLISDTDETVQGISSLASVAKASTLLDRAGFMARQWKPGL
jgi:hypothetical protein